MKEKLKIKADKNSKQVASKFEFIDFVMTVVTTFILAQSLSKNK